MKTLCINQSTVSAYAFDDDQTVIQTPENTIVGNPAEFIIGDCNQDNSTLYKAITLPTDWMPTKYLFNGTDWTLNPDYVEPVKV